MNKSLSSALAVLVLFASACSATTLPTPTPTSVPNANPTSGTTSGNILYQDNFSDSNSGWTHRQNANSTMDYVKGGYHINITTSDLMAISIANHYFQSNVSIEVDATKTAGPDDNFIGVICRFQDENNFYFFAISSDGYAGIAMYKDSTMSILSGSSFESSSAVNQGAATNHIRADCNGNTLTLYVNGPQVYSITDSTFGSGRNAGLLARANGTSGVDILFSNFMVSRP
jgi:hypothetical protein